MAGKSVTRCPFCNEKLDEWWHGHVCPGKLVGPQPEGETDIDRAIQFAKREHQGQVDDTGKDYFTAHLEPVARIVSQITDDPELIAAAYLHDTLEDTKTTPLELKCLFGARVARIVWELTKKGEKDHYGYYFPNLKSRDAILIKFADRLSNLSRMEAWTENRKKYYLLKSRFWKLTKGDAIAKYQTGDFYALL